MTDKNSLEEKSDDNIHTEEELKKINIVQEKLTLEYNGKGLSRQPIEFSFARYLGFNRKISVNNISGEKAWIILAPAPIFSISSFGLDKVGQITFSSNGDYKCQQSPMLNDTARDFDLDNNQTYYSVFFLCDNKWKVHFRDRKINSTKYNINLLERHIKEAVEYEFLTQIN
jgi:hypothetical protein